MGKVLKQSFWTTIIIYFGVLLGFVNSLILFPNYLSTEQIGLIRQIISASSILLPLTTFGVSATYLKFYPNFKNDNRLKNEFLSIQFFLIIISFVIICSLLILFSDNIKDLFTEKSRIFFNYYHIVLKENEELIETDRVRKIIASRMIESKQISPHVTSFVEADITDVVNERLEIKKKFFKKHKTPISLNPIFIYCVYKAIKDFPLINISYINDKIIKKNYINIGIAVALKDDNLIVPVLKNVENMDFLTIVKKSNDLIKRTKENKLHPDELSGGTYTISNIGSFGNTMGTPIIMQPQVAILAIGTIKKVAAVVEGKNGDEIKIRNKVFLSHTYDHRIVDGALGGKFAQKVAYYIENLDIKSLIG